jgi:hypothetical protein
LSVLRMSGASVIAVALCAATPTDTPPWGAHGHRIAARAAAATLPDEMPAFFRDATDQLVWLDPEPDRWRDFEARAMDQAWRYDHYVDFENLPDGALDAPDRFAFLGELYAAGMRSPARDAGFLPYRIEELYQRLVSSWERWERSRPGSDERGWIESRILNDAGILGHYVTDGSQPHHTTIHFNGWDADTPNPEGFTTDRELHARFETEFVSAHVQLEHIVARVPDRPSSVAGNSRYAVLDFLWESHEAVPRLYELDRDVGFAHAGSAPPAARDFVADRLAAGSAMLATLWWSSFVEGTGSAH